MTFNVLDDQWIPVLNKDGMPELLSIRETLSRASELTAISSISPLEDFSIYRFLSVFLMDALRPQRGSAIIKMLNKGSFDMSQIELYIAMCKNEGVSFDLFDRAHPFLQSVYDGNYDKSSDSATRMDLTFPSGNNHVHYEHRTPSSVKYSPAEAFRMLLVTHVFMPRGGAGYSYGINGDPPYMALVVGKTLFETLCYMLVPTDEHSLYTTTNTAWSYAPPQPKEEIKVVPLLRGLLFPSRRIQLIPGEEGAVSEIYFNPGYMYRGENNWTDPNVAYIWKKEGLRKPVLPDYDISIWRNYAELVREKGRPEIISRYMRYDPYWENASIRLYGLQTNQGSCVSLMCSTLVIPRAVLEDDSAAEWIDQCINDAESMALLLGRALRVALQNEAVKAKSKDRKKNNAVVSECVQSFYSQCEPPFLALISEAGDTQADNLDSMLEKWNNTMLRCAQDIFYKAVNNVYAGGKMLKNICSGEKILNAKRRSKD